jgi:hypothetical protein
MQLIVRQRARLLPSFTGWLGKKGRQPVTALTKRITAEDAGHRVDLEGHPTGGKARTARGRELLTEELLPLLVDKAGCVIETDATGERYIRPPEVEPPAAAVDGDAATAGDNSQAGGGRRPHAQPRAGGVAA